MIVIPARWGSTRFPGKPLAMIAGVSLIQRVVERALRSRNAAAVYVATDDDRIFRHVAEIGANVVKPEGDFQSGTDRIAAALHPIETLERTRFHQVINLQGDEPLIDIDAVDDLIDILQSDRKVDIATLAAPLTDDEFARRDVVKVVTNLEGDALYFSRAAIPHASPRQARRHIGIYAYQIKALRRFSALPPSPLEQAESLEQLRALQNGLKIRVLETRRASAGVDTPDDIARVEHELATEA